MSEKTPADAVASAARTVMVEREAATLSWSTKIHPICGNCIVVDFLNAGVWDLILVSVS